jgi:hypothetical protein
MKKHILLTCNLLIVFSIVVSFVLMAYQDTRTYQQLAENHLENILSLAGTDVSRYIENSMTIPLTVSKTMANDEFLKGWLLEEPKNISNPSYLEELYTYLKAYQEKTISKLHVNNICFFILHTPNLKHLIFRNIIS